ncbi:MAG: hypoxanthine-guanine phosphoribosyltransferase [Candidatus Thiodiazotropha lotti]|uniref:Hypoxanthine-guanine phosphoribosyltransferase n=1 Tax=Candidatus Thiodiazotropha endoloripes TaxID=1818881 RepID=A0A1E2UT31_9GAMM|nr:hypoxanthine-guanine phosphoribosyltransferase [Candidatus Thiodiazotropha endoloripes]MCG7898575.1 hypoxanthine-guanine phosphoribosyltransferase [Candidatus Thiodiazotropha weberae]MCG7990796.1 hypoxanthine-guanine phosphoribosyltransferase [Candidatus Thiodiazotropha lotti]MCG7901428.1 hypoxanthine-guanine phosphoribosyltransferase [Candidatus Thiodiazotropha weberae]MCG7913706.1 hypoxanthine-guanine phosphoribosyltransferase [Candidatus Thiodiazotropha weberae]MCG7999340.1 hypoxanthine-
MMISAQQAAEVLATADLIYDNQQISQALDQMALEISDRLANRDPLVLCVMNGALIPAGQLLTRLNFPLRHDYIHATRYRGGTSGSELEWKGHPSASLSGETILIIDDILDHGITLAAIVEACQEAGAEEVLSAVLVEKRHDRGIGFKADFIGLQVEDRYVFGYGMDYKGYHRNAPAIYAIPES